MQTYSTDFSVPSNSTCFFVLKTLHKNYPATKDFKEYILFD